MKGVNRATILGNLTKDPEIRYTPNSQAVCNFSVATNESVVDKEGGKKDRTEFHRVVAWGKLAEICGEFLSKGSPVYIEGRLTTRGWEDKEGNKKYTTEIVATQMVSLGGRAEAPEAKDLADVPF